MRVLHLLSRLWLLVLCLLVASLAGISVAVPHTIDTATKKSCPPTIPMLIGGETATAACSLDENPTGDAGDPACFYVDYSGAGTTATCGCLNFTAFGGEGEFWDCIHSGSACPSLGTPSGTRCGIHGIDFLNQTFEGTDAVAGYGCDLADGQSCLCHHILGDDDPVSPWAWQCRLGAQDAGAGGGPGLSPFLILGLLGASGWW